MNTCTLIVYKISTQRALAVRHVFAYRRHERYSGQYLCRSRVALSPHGVIWTACSAKCRSVQNTDPMSVRGVEPSARKKKCLVHHLHRVSADGISALQRVLWWDYEHSLGSQGPSGIHTIGECLMQHGLSSLDDAARISCEGQNSPYHLRHPPDENLSSVFRTSHLPLRCQTSSVNAEIRRQFPGRDEGAGGGGRWLNRVILQRWAHKNR